MLQVEERLHRRPIGQIRCTCSGKRLLPVMICRIQGVQTAREVERNRVLDHGDVVGVLEDSARPGRLDRSGQVLLSEAPQPLGRLAVDLHEVLQLPHLPRRQQPGSAELNVVRKQPVALVRRYTELSHQGLRDQVLLTSSRRRCTERLPTGVHYLLDPRGRYTADRRDVAPAPFDNVEPDDTGKENSTPQLPPLVLMEQISEHPDRQRYGGKNHRPMLAPRQRSPATYHQRSQECLSRLSHHVDLDQGTDTFLRH
jgi:hypothetical protein